MKPLENGKHARFSLYDCCKRLGYYLSIGCLYVFLNGDIEGEVCIHFPPSFFYWVSMICLQVTLFSLWSQQFLLNLFTKLCNSLLSFEFQICSPLSMLMISFYLAITFMFVIKLNFICSWFKMKDLQPSILSRYSTCS